MDNPAQHVQHRYAHGEHRPLGGYVATGLTYAVAAGGLLIAGKRKGAAAETRISASDLALITVATHRLARTLAKDAVTSPLRAPVTRYRETGMPSEVNEEVAPEVKDRPLLHTIGELVTCPFCLGQWVATGLVGGHVLAPTLTRLVTSTLTAVAGADALQFAYSALQRLEGSDEG
ncbi:MAG TPA: DUF1360 domain-containing protein [Segeticoccus sp.]|uniref:DUF1360 domain-containing protein n=1 Tax=Segeticoccus sp. TaxID=2706531 RepID=UPI002D7FCCF9|nr:DUF1360 domain-containing protein [Segeticoccus sp.]HET8601561.1 DUF1360 domain-containing protein [Segeticoccus sp.]